MSAGVTVMFVLFALLLGAAAVSDLARFTIPNWICGVLAVLMLTAMAAAPDRYDWTGHLGAGGLALAVGAAMFRVGAVGGGDVKLFAALALWAGFDGILDLLVAIVLAGAVLAAALVVLRRTVAPAVQPGHLHRLPRVLRVGEGVPYGLAIAAGGAWQAPQFPAFAGLI